METTGIQLGKIVDIKINCQPNPTYIVGEVQGLRNDWGNPDGIAIKLAGLDNWITVDENVEVEVID